MDETREINEIRQAHVHQVLGVLASVGRRALELTGSTTLELWAALQIFSKHIEGHRDFGSGPVQEITQSFLRDLPERKAAADEFMAGKAPS